jgi:cytochrome c553
MSKILFGAAAIALAFAAGGVAAADSDDIAQGEALATRGSAGVTPCEQCHGTHGEGNADVGFPRLVGQSAAYLQRQLDAFAGGSRVHPIMQPIARAMSPAQRAAAAAYYESLWRREAAAPAAAASTPASAAPDSLGAMIARAGLPARDVQACASCHGAQGTGDRALYPALAGQHASYLRNALAEWKNGARRTDPSGQMPRIASALSDAEVGALAAYFAALPAPAPPGAR